MEKNIIVYEAEGVLWIGDPHQKARRPGRRTDKDFSFTVAKKLEQAIEIANQRRLIPFILGDMFDDADDMDAQMLYRTAKALRSSWVTPWTLVGNHERKHHLLTEDTALAILEVSGVINTLEMSGAAFVIECERNGQTMRIGVGGTPNGQDIPDSVEDIFEGVDEVWWSTHHDMAFEGAYPGASALKEVKGAAILVNGHMHLTKPPVKVGASTWYNPGNITRMSIDTKDHIPRVWSLTPWEDMLGIPLEHEREAFDMTGRQVSPLKPGVENDDSSIPCEEESSTSVFVSMLKEESSTAPVERSEDGVFIAEAIHSKLETKKADLGDDADLVLMMLTELHNEAVKHIQSKATK